MSSQYVSQVRGCRPIEDQILASSLTFRRCLKESQPSSFTTIPALHSKDMLKCTTTLFSACHAPSFLPSLSFHSIYAFPPMMSVPVHTQRPHSAHGVLDSLLYRSSSFHVVLVRSCSGETEGWDRRCYQKCTPASWTCVHMSI